MTFEKAAYQADLFNKKLERNTCATQLRKLKHLKKSIEGEVKKWLVTYKKHNTLEATKNVIMKGRFEGNKAKAVKKIYHDRVFHMHHEYLQKITRVCEDLDAQIANVEAYITELDVGITKLQDDLDNMEE